MNHFLLVPQLQVLQTDGKLGGDGSKRGEFSSCLVLISLSSGLRGLSVNMYTSTSKRFADFPQGERATLDRAKISRLAENKRRSRARHREYVLDLERRLEDVRKRGVQATKEVQTAARQVALENKRLRELLLLAGFETEHIDLWAKSGPDAGSRGGDDLALCEIEQRAELCATAAASGPAETTGEKRTPPSAANLRQEIDQAEYIANSRCLPKPANDLSRSRSSTSGPGDSNEAATAPLPQEYAMVL